MSTCSSAFSSTADVVRVKWDDFSTLHRFSIDPDANYGDLVTKITEINPDFDGHLAYIDDEGDCITFSTTVELHELIALCNSIPPTSTCLPSIKIKSVARKNSNAIPKPTPTIPLQNAAPPSAPKVAHPGIICDGCEKSVMGIRYKCIVCDDFDLCEVCERIGMHAEHAMLRQVSPRTPMPAFVYANRVGWNRRRRNIFIDSFEPKCPRFKPNRRGGNMGETLKCAFSDVMNKQREEELHRAADMPHNPVPPPQSQAEQPQNQQPADANMEEEQPDPFTRFVTPVALQNAFAMASQAFQQATQRINQTASTPPAVNAPPAEQLSYNAAQAAQIALSGVAQSCEILQKNVVSQLNVENPQLHEALNRLSSVLNAGQQLGQQQTPTAFPRAPASTPANIASPARNTDPTTTPAEPHQPEDEKETFDASMDVVSQSLNVIDLCTAPKTPVVPEETMPFLEEQVVSMSDSTCTAIEMSPATNDNTPPPAMEESQMETFYEATTGQEEAENEPQRKAESEPAPELEREHSPVNGVPSSRMSVLSDIEVISMGDEDHDNDDDERYILAGVRSDSQAMLDGGDGWMVLSRGNYEEMCRFYESQRRMTESQSSSISTKTEATVQLQPPTATEPVQTEQETSPQPEPTHVDVPTTASVVEAVIVSLPEDVPSQPTPSAPVVSGVSGSSRTVNIYPQLEVCQAGTPYYDLSAYFADSPHTRRCPIEHPAENIQQAVNTLVDVLGFDNCNGWLTGLCEKFDGRIEDVLTEMEKDSVYSHRLLNLS